MGHTIPVSMLGDIGDMPMTDALQALMDRGCFGDTHVGKNFFEVFDVKFKASDRNTDFDDLYDDVVDACEKLEEDTKAGRDSTESRAAYDKALTTYNMMVKLSSQPKKP